MSARAGIGRLDRVQQPLRLPGVGMGAVARAAARAWLALVVLFIYAPILVVIGASFDPGHFVSTRAYLQFPPRGFTLHWYFVEGAGLWASVWTSLELAAAVAIGSVLVGVPAAFGLVRGEFPGRNLLATVFRVPLQIPFIVTGVAFLQAYYAIAAATGLKLHGTFVGLLLGHLFVGIPYVIGATGALLLRLNPRFEEAALSLGASRRRTFTRVTVPIIAPGVFGGALYAFLISFTDVTIALFLAPQNQTTFPVRTLASLQMDMEPALPAVATIVFLASIAGLFALQRLLGIETLLRGAGRNH